MMGRQIIARVIRRLAFRAIRASDRVEYPGYQLATIKRLRAARRRWARGVYYVPAYYLGPDPGLCEVPGRYIRSIGIQP